MNTKEILQKEIDGLPKEIASKNEAEKVQISIKYPSNYHFILDDDRSVVEDFIKAEAEYIDLPFYKTVDEIEPPQKIVFHNRQAIGDILTMTCAIRDFKNKFPETKVGVSTVAMHIWDNNPYIDHSFRDSRFQLNVGPGFLTNKSNSINLHMCNAFRVDIENKTGLSIPQGPIHPDIWMTEEEYNRPPLIDGPYWIFIYGGEPGWPSKQYHRWQEVINILRDDIKFVQLGVKNHPYPKLN
jgi:hypothetical protein